MALFSDDGCNVTLKGNLIHQHMQQGQHLPDLQNSFHVLPIALAPGEPIEMRIDYSNIIYVADPKSPGYPDIDGCALFLYLIPCGIVPDFNRDGIIDDEDRGKVTKHSPWRWWVNDDNDNGDVSNEDIPLGIDNPNSDAALGSNHIDGSCDLIDWFPLFLDLKNLMEVLPPEEFQYYLRQENAAVNFVYTELKPDKTGSYLRNGAKADLLKNARSFIVFANGTTRLSIESLSNIRNAGKGIFLFEGANLTDKPLYLEVLRNGLKVAEIPFHLEIGDVEQMYRWINLRGDVGQPAKRQTDIRQPSNYPDHETNGSMFIFIHGYNVDEAQSRGWTAEGFKRLYQSGSNAMFTGVSWHGNSSQLALVGHAPDYWENVSNVFKASAALAQIVNRLPGETKVSAAHSLGNMLVSSAVRDHAMGISKHFLLDAAIAIEAFDASALNIDEMRNPDWSSYNTRLWSAEWHKLFQDDDGRSKLTWRGRFGSFPQFYNFYSSGEDVLNNSDGLIPFPGAEHAWVLQEMIKGTNHPGAQLTFDSQGGWGFNSYWYVEQTQVTPEGVTFTEYRRTSSEADQLTDEQLKLQPFFKRFQEARLMDPIDGSVVASEYLTRAKTLGDAIPALSFAAGRNPVSNLEDRNFDLMNLKSDEGGWPPERLADDQKRNRWLHNDAKDLAYRYNYKLYQLWVDLGGLK